MGVRCQTRCLTLWLAIGLTAFCLVATPARAYHTDKDRLIDYTAYTLNQNEFRLGVVSLEYGIIDELMVGTYTVPWIAFGITGKTFVNGFVKARPLNVGNLTMSARATVFYVNATDISFLDIIENGNVNAIFLPLSVAASYAFSEAWNLSLEGTFVRVFGNAAGNVQPQDFKGSGAQDNLQIATQLEWRISRVTAFTLRGRWVPWASATAIETTVTLDAGGRLEVQAAATTPITNAWVVIPGVALSWSVFNLNVGLGYGNVFLPGIGLVSGNQYPAPELNIFARF
jgi:hypothetical protein